jgi:hypothetical protein
LGLALIKSPTVRRTARCGRHYLQCGSVDGRHYLRWLARCGRHCLRCGCFVDGRHYLQLRLALMDIGLVQYNVVDVTITVGWRVRASLPANDSVLLVFTCLRCNLFCYWASLPAIYEQRCGRHCTYGYGTADCGHHYLRCSTSVDGITICGGAASLW